jgi:hypothetical protein
MPNPRNARLSIEIETELLVWLAVHGNLVLALRHPDNRGPSRALVKRFAAHLLEILVAHELLSQEEAAAVEQEQAAAELEAGLTTGPGQA